MFGACSAMAFDDRVAERVAPASSHTSPGLRWYGAYCTKHDITCLPGGASDGSVSVGITMSMYGRLRERAVLRLVVGALHVVHARRDRDGAAQVLARGRAGT